MKFRIKLKNNTDLLFHSPKRKSVIKERGMLAVFVDGGEMNALILKLDSYNSRVQKGAVTASPCMCVHASYCLTSYLTQC